MRHHISHANLTFGSLRFCRVAEACNKHFFLTLKRCMVSKRREGQDMHGAWRHRVLVKRSYDPWKRLEERNAPPRRASMRPGPYPPARRPKRG